MCLAAEDPCHRLAPKCVRQIEGLVRVRISGDESKPGVTTSGDRLVDRCISRDGHVEDRTRSRAHTLAVVRIHGSLREDHRICTHGIGRAQDGAGVAGIRHGVEHDDEPGSRTRSRSDRRQRSRDKRGDGNDALGLARLRHCREDLVGRQGDTGSAPPRFVDELRVAECRWLREVELEDSVGQGLAHRLGALDDEGTALSAVPSVVQVADLGDARGARRRQVGRHRAIRPPMRAAKPSPAPPGHRMPADRSRRSQPACGDRPGRQRP